MRAYAIGDIHGHLDLLLKAQALVAEDRARTHDTEAPLIHTGDLVDRGPESRGVIAHLMAGQARGEPWVVLKGNHDLMFQKFMEEPEHRFPALKPGLTWLHGKVGGRPTLESYGVELPQKVDLAKAREEALRAVPPAHVTWISRLPLRFLCDDLLFVHAGIRPGIDLRHQSEEDLLWIRYDFLNDRRDHGVLVVHGHTPVDRVTHYGNHLDIDSNAARGGPVSAVAIEGRQAWLLTPEGRVALD